MKIKNKSLLITILSFIFITQSYAQTSWANVEGKTNEEIKEEIISAATNAQKIDTDRLQILESDLAKQNLDEKQKFNKLEAQYTQAAMNSQSALNRAKMNRLNAITELNALRTNFENKQQIFAINEIFCELINISLIHL